MFFRFSVAAVLLLFCFHSVGHAQAMKVGTTTVTMGNLEITGDNYARGGSNCFNYLLLKVKFPTGAVNTTKLCYGSGFEVLTFKGKPLIFVYRKARDVGGMGLYRVDPVKAVFSLFNPMAVDIKVSQNGTKGIRMSVAKPKAGQMDGREMQVWRWDNGNQPVMESSE